ncbi:glycosyltransferase [Pedobacter montanisoli]|uniref:Glycosyltransferase n=1 Tax=Pedobacter montanisoli TaxID=2923277 RepID=A0ABS9ZVV8_9SPHI|nr:glycosyltransferase [Pedobacter montanisoli]MCJ0742445.1 glycosyltransferase [Pedobacter montanisoli]
MIKDKILIYAPISYDQNAGGPTGFISQNLLDKPRELFTLSNDLVKKYDLYKKILYKLNQKLTNKSYWERHFDNIKAYKYQYIYFHDCNVFNTVKHKISSKQTVILQAHCPELPSEEGRSLGFDQEKIKEIINAEQSAFNRADILVFPNEHILPIYSSLINKNSQIEYILSGAKASDNLKSYPLAEQKINLLYIGRRNKIKGFDLLLDTFKMVSKERSDLNLIVVGKGEDVTNHDLGIYDVGFSSTPNNWFNSVDYIINTNRQSYFDLSIIEALSTGTPIIMSNNFGHKYFESKSSLISTYDINKPTELYNILNGPLRKKRADMDNILLFQKELTDKKYFSRFEAFCKRLI